MMIMKYHELVHNLHRWLRFSEFLVHFPGVGGIASSRQLLDAAMEFQAAKDFDKARIFFHRFIGVGGIHMLATCWTTSWKLIQSFGFQSFWCNTRTNPSRTEANGGSSGVLFERG